MTSFFASARFLYLLSFLLVCLLPRGVQSQDIYDDTWYTDAAAFVKIAVTQDGVYRVTGAELAGAGLALSSVDPSTIALLKNGEPVPVWIEGGTGASLQADDALVFVGEQNRGDEELWAFENVTSRQGSDYFSLYSDTTWYWMRWGGEAGLRYANTDPTQPLPGATAVSSTREVVHAEEDIIYYFGDSNDAAQPQYTRGEGFVWLNITHIDSSPITQSIPMSLEGLASDADSVHIKVRLSSASGTRHLVSLSIDVNGTTLTCGTCSDSADWSGYAFRTLEVAVPRALVGGNASLTVNVNSNNDFNSIANRVLIDWAEIEFDRTLFITDAQRTFSADQAGPQSFQLSQAVNEAVVVYSPANNRRFVMGTGASPMLNDDPAQGATYWATTNAGYATPPTLQLHTTRDLGQETEPVDYLIITTPALAASAQTLADYREQVDGYRTRIVFQHDIFNQYDYGRPTPLAIRNFVHQALRWTTPPQFLMFWGDSIRPENSQARRPLREWEVISFGYAPADPWFGMQLEGDDDWLERIAIGRIPIRENATGDFFVTKLGNYESSNPGAWQKKFMLLVGGQNSLEQARLQQHAIRWSGHAASRPASMDSLWFFKQATDPLDPTFRDSLSAAFKNGAAWVSYFGHSAADTWEIVTDAPEDYDNANVLPIVVSMGCNTGNFSGGLAVQADRLVYGERLVLASLNGSIAHWGSSSASTIDQPAALANEVHQVVFQDTLRILGNAFQEAKTRYLETASRSKSTFTVILQYALIGDPATRIQIPDRPELQTSPDAITILPVTPVPSNEKLETEVNIRSWGLTPADSVQIQLTHNRPNQTSQSFFKNVLPEAIETAVSFDVPITEDDIGENRIQITIDPANAFAETNEANNTATRSRTVFSTGLAPIFPLDFAVVPDLQPRLRTGLASSDTTTRTVVFELDTVPTFDSPTKQTFTTSTIGIVADWPLASPLADQTVYHWRARIEDETTSPWVTAQFTTQVSAASGGWQQTGQQFATNATDPFLAWNTDDAAWEFDEFRVDLRYASERGDGFEKGQIVVNGTLFESTTLGYGIVVLNGSSGEVRFHNSYPTYQIREELELRFDTDSTRAVIGLDSLLTNLTPGDYVITRTRHLGNLSGPTIQPEVKALFSNIGSTAIDTLTYSDLWLMVTRVGFPEETAEWVEPASNPAINEIVQDTSLFFMQPEGFTLSPPIGPARSWGSLNSEATIPNAESNVRIDVMNQSGTDVILPDIPAATLTDMSGLSSTTHPYIRLRATLADASQQSTPQLELWRVDFEPTAELGILPTETRFSADTVRISEPVRITTSIENLSEVASEEATLQYTLTDASNQERVLGADTLRVLQAGETESIEFEIATGAASGENRLRIELAQPGFEEPYTLNNVLIKEFLVENDTDKPRLDVFIDNEMLPANPEPVRNLQDPSLPFVNAQPTIEMVIADDNPFQLLADTSLFQIQFDRSPILFSNPAVQFQPATPGNNEARVFFTPDLSGRDTTHTLFLRVFDVAGNEAEGSPYQVHFRVQTSFEIESLYPYPNPMAEFTTFAFQLRGSDATLTEDFRLRIYTVAGRLIKEFDLIKNPQLLEIPGLRIGWNKFQWDGRDADGDHVAPGVYLYKVFLRSDGHEISVNNGSSIEKLVVLR